MTIQTVTIEKNRKPYLFEKIEKLNKKAKKLGFPNMALSFSEETVKEFKDEYGNDQVKIYLDATLEYEIPIIDGWELICTFDIVQDPTTFENIVFTSKVPDKTIPSEYLNKTSIECQHCGYVRRRNHSMLMRHIDSDEYKEVGSTCIKDFFGHDPSRILQLATFNLNDLIGAIDDEYFGEHGERGTYAYPIHGFLSLTAAVIERYGWVSGKRAYEDDTLDSTKSEVMTQLYDRHLPKEFKVAANDDDKKLAEETIEYFSNIDPGDNDYLVNCNKVAILGYVPEKMSGVACSMIAVYKREKMKNIERESRPESNWIGKEKERIRDLDVKCIFEMAIENNYSYDSSSRLYIFVDNNGNKIKTFYSGCKWHANQGLNYKLTGTVKKHDEYKGEKVTQLTRCQVTELETEVNETII